MSSPLSIRPFRLSDMDRILEIELASYGEDSYDRNLFAEYCNKCGCLFLVVVRGRSVCGYILTCIGGRSAVYRAELISIAVDPQRRGKGVATVLMDGTLRRLRRRGVVRLNLMVKVTNHPAIALYRKYGFEQGRIVRKYYEDGEDGRQMSKSWH